VDARTYPLITLADHVNLFDSGATSNSTSKEGGGEAGELQLIYYQLLSLGHQASSKLEAHFV
jgi:hypothetical protein